MSESVAEVVLSHLREEHERLREMLASLVRLDQMGIPRDSVYYQQQLALAESMLYAPRGR